MRAKSLLILLTLGLLLAACGGETTEPEVIRETVEVVVQEEVTRVVTETETVTEIVTETETVTEIVTEVVEIIPLPTVDPSEFSGDIAMAGSSTVFPLAERMAERFNEEGYSGTIALDSIGSGGGFERFCVEGESDISNASRPIRDSEIESCRAIGREPIEFRVGTDALAVVVSSDNDFVEGCHA